MLTVNHTPGPWNWHAQGDANDYCLLTNGARWVISFRQNGEFLVGEELANAQLIASSPELLSALQAVAGEVTDGVRPTSADSHLPSDIVRLVHSAIAKATGKAES